MKNGDNGREAIFEELNSRDFSITEERHESSSWKYIWSTQQNKDKYILRFLVKLQNMKIKRTFKAIRVIISCSARTVIKLTAVNLLARTEEGKQ